MNLKLALANLTGRMLRYFVTRSKVDSEVYWKQAGIDYDGLRDPRQAD